MYDFKDVIAAAIAKTLSGPRIGFGTEALAEVTRLIKNADDSILKDTAILCTIKITNPEPDADGNMLAERHFDLVDLNTEEAQKLLEDPDCAVLLTLRDWMNILIKKAKSLGYDLAPPRSQQQELDLH